jgi:hypothetical protein
VNLPSLFILVGVGVGAYYLGRHDGSESAKHKQEITPRPPLPQLPAPPDPTESVDYSAEWDQALEQYDIDIFPPESAVYASNLLPPPPIDGISVAPQCQAVAVGEQWWDHAWTRAEQLVMEGESHANAAHKTLKTFAPTCVNRQTLAAQGLYQEFYDWIRTSPERNGPTGKT